MSSSPPDPKAIKRGKALAIKAIKEEMRRTRFDAEMYEKYKADYPHAKRAWQIRKDLLAFLTWLEGHTI